MMNACLRAYHIYMRNELKTYVHNEGNMNVCEECETMHERPKMLHITKYENSLSKFLIQNNMTLSELAEKLQIRPKLISEAFLAKRPVKIEVAEKMKELSGGSVELFSKNGEITKKIAQQIQESKFSRELRFGKEAKKSEALQKKCKNVLAPKKFFKIMNYDNQLSLYLRKNRMTIAKLAKSTGVPDYVIVRSVLGLFSATNEQKEAVAAFTEGAVQLNTLVHKSLIKARLALYKYMQDHDLEYNTFCKKINFQKEKLQAYVYGRITPNDEFIDFLKKATGGEVDFSEISAKSVILRTMC